jgi:hypothetical protein
VKVKDGWWTLSSEALSAVVHVQDGTIDRVWSPIARKFIGQPVANMVRWMERQGGFWMQPFHGFDR